MLTALAGGPSCKRIRALHRLRCNVTGVEDIAAAAAADAAAAAAVGFGGVHRTCEERRARLAALQM